MQTKYPNFRGTKKFAEGCRQALRPKAPATLDVLPVRSSFARKKRLPTTRLKWLSSHIRLTFFGEQIITLQASIHIYEEYSETPLPL